DNPPGHEEPVVMLKEGGGLCRRCYYIKRGSLANMRLSELVQNLQTNDSFKDKFARMRESATQFSILHPTRKWRHEKPDLKVLLERKDEEYVDVSEIYKWQSLKKFTDTNYPSEKFKNDAQRRAFCVRMGVKLQVDDRGVEGVAMPKNGAKPQIELVWWHFSVPTDVPYHAVLSSEDEEKEIKIGRRISSGKIRQEDLGDGSEYTRDEIAALRAKNAKGMAMNLNSKD
ncbi:unnamed protein product, partial [Symbiodinium necroappetens]